MSDAVQQVPAEGTDESWERSSDEFDIRGVGAVRSADFLPLYDWQVWVAVAEFVRTEPLESELRSAIAAALGVVPGVVDVREEDREVWAVKGDPSGDALTRAAAAVVDGLADRLRRHYNGL